MTDPQDRRNREADLIASLKLYRQDPGLLALRRLLEMRLERQNSVLRRCSITDFPSDQARARVIEELLREIIT